MKTAVSIPDDTFRAAERLARRMKKSRSEVYSRALADYLARHLPDEVTAAMDAALEDIPQAAEPFTGAAARMVLERTEW